MNFKADLSHGRAGVASSDWRAPLARLGLSAKGILHGALGVLALNVAMGDSSAQTASQRGAVELVASQPLGQWLLLILTVGLFALTIWQAILAFKGDPVEGSETKDRVKFGGKALLYLGTASVALSVLLSHWGSGSSVNGLTGGGSGSAQDQAAATVMSWPGGPWLVALIGAGVIGVAVYQFVRHTLQKKFMQRLGGMHGTVRTVVERAGQWGYAARAIVFLIGGVFFIVAAVQHDPQEAIGLSGVLSTLAQQSWGQAVLWVVALGLLFYGAFCFAEAKYRRAT